MILKFNKPKTVSLGRFLLRMYKVFMLSLSSPFSLSSYSSYSSFFSSPASSSFLSSSSSPSPHHLLSSPLPPLPLLTIFFLPLFLLSFSSSSSSSCSYMTYSSLIFLLFFFISLLLFSSSSHHYHSSFLPLADITRTALECFYYWVNYAPITRGTSATGYAVLLGIILSMGEEPEGTVYFYRILINKAALPIY